MEDKVNRFVLDNQIEYVNCKEWDKYEPILSHLYTMKTNGIDFKRRKDLSIFNSSCDSVAKYLGIPRDNIAKTDQQHTDNIHVIEKKYDFVNEFSRTDALLTNIPNICLLLTFADCTPIYLFDHIKKVIGLVHSGWKGTVKRIVSKSVKKMIEVYGSDPLDIQVYIGPCIRQCHFEVDEDVKDMFNNEFSSCIKKDKSIIKKGDIKDGKRKYYIDTTKINIMILEEIGIKRENIYDSDICTVCDSDKYHSYRIEKKNYGVNGAIMILK